MLDKNHKLSTFSHPTVYNASNEQADRLILNNENTETEHSKRSVEHFNKIIS